MAQQEHASDGNGGWNRPCKGVAKASGQPCRGWAGKDSDYCMVHDPDPVRRKRMQAARSNGGRIKAGEVPLEIVAKRFTRSDDLLDILAEAIGAVRRGEITASVAGSIGSLSAAYIKVLEFFTTPGAAAVSGIGPEDVALRQAQIEVERKEAMGRIRELYGLSSRPTHLTAIPAGSNGTGNGTH